MGDQRRRLGTTATVVALVTAPLGCSLFTSFDDLDGDEPAAPATDGGVATPSDGTAGDVAVGIDGGSPPGVGNAEQIAKDAPGAFGVAVDSTNVYWTNPETGVVWRAPKSGAAPPAAVPIDAFTEPSHIAVFGGRVFIGSRANNGLVSVLPDGASPKRFAGAFRINAIAAADALYYARVRPAYYDFDVSRIDLAGTETILLSDTTARTVTFDGASTYITSTAAPREIRRIQPDRTTTTIATVDEVVDLQATLSTVFALTLSGKELSVSTAAEPVPKELATGLAGARRFVFDGDALFVTSAGLSPTSGRVVRVALDGSGATDVATGQNGPSYITADASGLYWVNAGDSTIMRARRR